MRHQNIFLIIIGIFFLCGILSGQENNKLTFMNQSLSTEQRINDLVSRLTLQEKVQQMISDAPAIPRLSIPEYAWWNEALHGVARAGIATVFPQAIGLAATWDDKLIFDIADIISTEARAKYHEGIRTNNKGQLRGLTIWSPNINIFRDPRWGRGQETYGEDPFLTSRIGLAFVKGLQGNDPKYFKTIATPKHYAVHSGPESSRHYFDAVIGNYDLWETYLPAFESLIKEGNAYSIMGAYNRLMNAPCCADPNLLQTILRDKWKFNGFVVSDCGAIDDIWRDHKTVATKAEAAALSVKAGCDLNCGDTYLALVEAVKQGLITEAEIDVNLKRLFEARFRLGLFDPIDGVKYAHIPYSANDTEDHRKTALQAARESIVLLKNSNQILPLKKDLKTIAVIGPNANNERVMFGNYNGIPSKAITPLDGIKNKVSSDVNVLYTKGCNWITPANKLNLVTHNMLFTGEKNGLYASYYANRNLLGEPIFIKHDKNFDFDWIKNPPSELKTTRDFSIRWVGKIAAPETGKYLFSLTGDDGFRLYIDDKLVINAWNSQPLTTMQSEVEMIGNKKYDIKIEYFQNGEDASLKFEYAIVSDYDPFKEAAEIAAKSDAVIFFGGISPSLEGEDMPVHFDGFDRGDRTKLDLPIIQDSLLKILFATGKPIVLVLMSGSALSVNWAEENLSAILQSWYPGEEGGNAIADVLFGDYNPSGRLPVTFYKSVDQLPPFEDYNMKGRTYKYFEGDVLYPFGFGLSYSTFQYSNLQMPSKINAGDSLIVNIDVKNVSSIEGDEVVQLYVSTNNSNYTVPIRSLQGFQRIHLKSGETKKVTFVLKPKQMSLVDNNGNRVIEPGTLTISVGGGQPGQLQKFKITSLSSKIELKGNRVNIE